MSCRISFSRDKITRRTTYSVVFRDDKLLRPSQFLVHYAAIIQSVS